MTFAPGCLKHDDVDRRPGLERLVVGRALPTSLHAPPCVFSTLRMAPPRSLTRIGAPLR